MLKGTFGITAETTKNQVGEELGKVGEAVEKVKVKLESIKTDSNDDLIKNKIEGVITKAIDTLGKIVDGTSKIKEATKSASGKIANTGSGDNDAAVANIGSVKGLVEGINLILGAAKEVGSEPKGDAKKSVTDSKEVAKLFNDTGNANNADALKGAGRAVSTASGADILAAIEEVKGKSDASGNMSAAKNAYDIAVAAKNNADAHNDVRTKGSVIAAGLALKAMSQGGKLATATNTPGEAVNAVLIGAVGKTVNEIISTIRRTVDKCLKNVSDCIKEDSSNIVKSNK